MPVYEYKCNKCNKKLEVLQSSFNSLLFCEEANFCSEHGELKRLVSSFVMKGSSTAADSFMESISQGDKKESHTHNNSCGCFGAGATCANDSIGSMID